MAQRLGLGAAPANLNFAKLNAQQAGFGGATAAIFDDFCGSGGPRGPIPPKPLGLNQGIGH